MSSGISGPGPPIKLKQSVLPFATVFLQRLSQVVSIGPAYLQCRLKTRSSAVPLNISLSHTRLLKIIETGTNLKLGYDFLFGEKSFMFSRFDSIPVTGV